MIYMIEYVYNLLYIIYSLIVDCDICFSSCVARQHMQLKAVALHGFTQRHPNVYNSFCTHFGATRSSTFIGQVTEANQQTDM